MHDATPAADTRDMLTRAPGRAGRGQSGLYMVVAFGIVAILAVFEARSMLQSAAPPATTTATTNGTGTTLPTPQNATRAARNATAVASAMAVAQEAVAAAASRSQAPTADDVASALGNAPAGQGQVTVAVPLGGWGGTPAVTELSVSLPGQTVQVCIEMPTSITGVPSQVDCP